MTATEREIERFLDDQLITRDVPGASVAVLDPDCVLYATGLGTRTLDPVEAVTPDSMFRVASVTKPFTGIAVLQLVERGDLDIDDDIRDYVEFLKDAPGEPVTVEELLIHSSGIPSDIVPQNDRIADREDLVRRFDRWADKRITDWERFMYCNGGYVILAALVAAVTECPYPVYVEEEILSLLGMERSTFDQDILKSDDNAMTGYVSSDGGLEQAEFDAVKVPSFRERLFGAFGMISTVTDLASILQCMMNGGLLDDKRLLKESTVESVCSQQSPPGPTIDGFNIHYGYGWRVEDLMGDTLVHHSGKAPGFHAFIGFLQDRELGVALGFNKSGLPKDEIGKGILALASGESPNEAVKWFKARQAVDAVTGIYESDRRQVTASVSPAGPEDFTAINSKIAVTIDEWDLQFQAAPDTECSDGYSFSSNMGNGHRWTVDFLETESSMDMLWARGAETLQFSKQ